MADSVSKKDLVGAVAKKVGLSQADTAKVMDELLGEISSCLAEGKKVRLIGFGTFEVRERAARKGVNPQTNQPMDIAASRAPSFKAGKELKDAIGGA